MTNAQFSFFTSPLLLCVLSTLILLATPQRLIPVIFIISYRSMTVVNESCKTKYFVKKIQGIRNLLKTFYTSDNELGENDEIPIKKTWVDLMKTLMLCDRTLFLLQKCVLNGLLRIGYINETVLPWNSGRPLLIRYIWGINTNNGNEIFAFGVL
uniref:LETM1 domain-containing protein n=1 Tax=Brugia pahangi TaxID=6280 RepID=A0A0N4T5Q3_BRUPA